MIEDPAYTPRVEYECDGSATHYQGCKCHEAGHRARVSEMTEEITHLKRRVDCAEAHSKDIQAAWDAAKEVDKYNWNQLSCESLRHAKRVRELEKLNANQAQTIGCLVDKNVENARLRDAIKDIADEWYHSRKRTMSEALGAAIEALVPRQLCNSCTPERKCPDHGSSLTDFEGERRPADTTTQYPEFNRGPLAPGEDPFKEFREQVKDKVYSKPSTGNHAGPTKFDSHNYQPTAQDIPKHDHTHSLYTHCLDCKTFGINMPSRFMDAVECGNCGSLRTVKYYPACCIVEDRTSRATQDPFADFCAKCVHPKGWHRKDEAACIECGCLEFTARTSNASKEPL